MISLTPTGSPAETNAASTLLAIIADPEAAKKRLAELVAEKQAAEEAMQNARVAAVAAKEQRDAADVSLAEAQRISAEFDASHETRSKQLDERNDLIIATDTRLKAYEAAVEAREKALGEPLIAREKAVATREAELTEREAALKAREDEAAGIKDDYEAKLAKLKALV